MSSSCSAGVKVEAAALISCSIAIVIRPKKNVFVMLPRHLTESKMSLYRLPRHGAVSSSL